MSVEHQTITVLISARKNSKYLAKFIFGLIANSKSLARMDIRIVLNEHDTWNRELQSYFEAYTLPTGDRPFTFFRENLRLGRAGLHEYFNLMLVDNPPGDWTIYFCEDHFINVKNWDQQVRDLISGKLESGDSRGKAFPLNPNDVWVLVPKFDNCGSMNHIVSRGFIDALGGVVGNHGWIDSYINDLMMPFRHTNIIRMDEELFHDFTHDRPSPMDDSHLQGEVSEKGKAMPKFDSDVTRHRIADDKIKLERAIAKEGRS